MIGIILGGGRATRLALASTPQNKLMQRVHGKPMLVRLLLQLRDSGCSNFVVVVSPETKSEVTQCLERCWLTDGCSTEVVLQPKSLGPGDALYRAVVGRADEVLVFCADTVVDTVPESVGDWIGVAPALRPRQWCVPRVNGGGFVDGFEEGFAQPGSEQVAVGLYRLSEPWRLTKPTPNAAEVQVSDLLRTYIAAVPVTLEPISEWHDTGDIWSLQDLQAQTFVTSAGSSLTPSRDGYIRKSTSDGSATAQVKRFKDMSIAQKRLFPRVATTLTERNSYEIERVTLPTLSELYLYRAEAVQDWILIISQLIRLLDETFWSSHDARRTQVSLSEAYRDRALRRLPLNGAFQSLAARQDVRVNGANIHVSGLQADLLEAFVGMGRRATSGMHGDPNFTNLLYSAETGSFRFIDPGAFLGGGRHVGDLYYDLAKLRQSYSGMYDAILSDLYTLEVRDDGSYMLAILPNRRREADEIDNYISSLGYDLNSIRLIEVLQLLSCVPFHRRSPERMLALTLRGLLQWQSLKGIG